MRKQRALISWGVPLFLVLWAGVLGALQGSRYGGDVTWATDYDTALAQAQRERKPVLISAHMPGCGWCRKMDAETFTDPGVVGLSRQFICVRIDSDVDSILIEKYRIGQFPMTLILNPEGREITRFAGYVPPERFATILKELLPMARPSG
ncbi:MAG: DUF255 domain-containing protein [Chloroherpetonaceae bacterium]|nr:DUF255 domain-containing protein [Chthonomonadaceae bacterium]MDW8206308.1 DUF255 domain-containing protein [Chloroherpetonaceae bacterium]